MKSTRFLLFLLFVVCTFNVSAQAEEPECLSLISGSTVYENLPIVIYSQEIDGFVYWNGYEQSIWQGQNHYEYQMRENVSPGDIITVQAWILGIGYTNTISVEVPENLKNPYLRIYVTQESMHQVSASIHEM